MSLMHKPVFANSKQILLPIAILAMLAFFPAAVHADEIGLWNFNDSNQIVDRGTGTLTTTANPVNVVYFTGTTVNAQMGDPAGMAIAIQGGANNQNNGSILELRLSTVGFSGISVSFATQRTATGFNSNQFQYSTDGTTFTNFGSPYTPAASFALQAFDLSGISGLNNNPLAAFRIIFNGATSESGNNRIDNLLVAGTRGATVPEPATLFLLSAGLAGVVAQVRKIRKSSRHS